MIRFPSRLASLPLVLVVLGIAGCGAASTSAGASYKNPTPAPTAIESTPGPTAVAKPVGTPVISGGGVAAVVNGQSVPMSKFRLVATLAVHQSASTPGVTAKALTGDVMNQIVSDELIRQYAAKHGITVTAAELQKQQTSDEGRLGGHAQLIARLKTFGLTLDQYKQLIVPSLLAQKVEAKIAPVKKVQQQTADVRHILIATKPQGKKPRTDAAAHALAQQVLAKLQHGASFAQLAKQYSDDPGSANTGGEYKGVKKGQMVAQFDQASFNDPLHKPRIIKTTFGYHIIEVLSRKTVLAPDPNGQATQNQAFTTWLAKQQKASKIQKIAKIDKL